jgi:hypothetical protein
MELKKPEDTQVVRNANKLRDYQLEGITDEMCFMKEVQLVK